jgi:hypothetical protein
MCHDSPLGLAPDLAFVRHDGTTMASSDSSFRLRPETMKSLFILYRVPGDVRYRDEGCLIFQPIVQHYRVSENGAFTSIRDV